MLILTRKPDESVVVGGSIGFEKMLKITVLEVKGDKVRLGFEVDKSVPVHRAEVWNRIHANGESNGQLTRPVNSQTELTGPTTLFQEEGHTRPAPAPRPATRRHGILVVDDEKSVRRALTAGMRQRGFTVWQAADGDDALDLYRANAELIDVVLVDVHMPTLDGPETLAALQEINSGIRCCFMSGDSGIQPELKLGNLGTVALIRKPFHLPEVVDMLWELATHEVRPSSV